jgi:outer membrane protein TolC
MRLRLLLLAMSGTLGACTVGPDYAPPQPPSSAALQSGTFLRAGEAVEAEMPAARWWDGMDDPVLSDLIDRGLREAPEIAVATARIRKARSGLAAA